METTALKICAFNNLPYELHSKIFQESMDGSERGQYLTRFKALQLGQVCKAWRDKIDTMPGLWSTVYVTPLECQEEVRRFKTILSKTASAPIQFFFCDEDDYKDISSSVTAPLIHSLRDSIRRHAHHIATVDIQVGWPPEWLPPLLLSLFHGLEYPKITTASYFTMDCEGETPEHNEEAAQFWSAFAPQSNRIEKLTAIPAEWLLGHVSQSYSWSSLVDLRFFWIESIESFFPALQHCEILKYLEIQYAEDCDQSEGWMRSLWTATEIL
jgi:hypothetical protein